MVAYENNKYYGMMYIFVSHALFLRPIDRFESVHTCCENDNILQSCRDGWILICWANIFMQHTYTLIRVTSLEQLSVAEFSGE
jgi:hypothetical protein